MVMNEGFKMSYKVVALYIQPYLSIRPKLEPNNS